jgi:hypothetical protein
MKVVRPELLQNRWLHSHEEDTGEQTVFRPASFAFPPSRGRTGFELKADQSSIEIGVAPTDGPQVSRGHWKLTGDQLQLFKAKTAAPTQTLQIISAEEDRLIVLRR